MKRKEEINQAAHQKYPYKGGTLGMICERSIPIFIQGAEWADRTMIDKAVKWLINNWREYVYQDGDGIVHFGHWENDFRKAMEEYS